MSLVESCKILTDFYIVLVYIDCYLVLGKWLMFATFCQINFYCVQWNLYNKTGEVLLKTHKFQHLSHTVFTKSCLFSLSWETTCLERPQNLAVALYRFYCTVETLYSTIYHSKYFIELNTDKSTQYVALWTHIRHPIPRPFGRAMECLLWVLQQKLIVL